MPHSHNTVSSVMLRVLSEIFSMIRFGLYKKIDYFDERDVEEVLFSLIFIDRQIICLKFVFLP